MNMKIKRTLPGAIIPTRKSPQAAGYDLHACIGGGDPKKDFVVIQPGETKKIDTGIAIEMPDGLVGLIYARSGIATKHNITPANCVGVIDSDYRGNYIVALHNEGSDPFWVYHGDRIAQLVFKKYETAEFEEVDELDETERGAGGFGSTGTKN